MPNFNFTLAKQPDEPIIIGVATRDWQSAVDMPAFIEQLTGLLDAADEPVFYIGDMTAWRIDMQEIIIAANQIARGENAIAHHSNIREFIVVSSSRVVELGVLGLKSAAFENTQVTVLPTVSAALDYARRIIQDERL